MRTYFSSTFIEKEVLNEAGIDYPIKLDYYKIINEDEMIKQEKAKFGIHVVKTEYKKEQVKVENKKIPYVSNDEKTRMQAWKTTPQERPPDTKTNKNRKKNRYYEYVLN